MHPLKLIFVLAALTTAWCASLYGQNSTTNTSTTPSMTETVKEFDRMMSNSEQLHRSTLRSGRVPRSFSPILDAIPQFRQATAELREAVGSQKSAREPLKDIEKLIKPVAEFFKDLNLKSPAPDVQEIKSYSQKDLLWETLTTAERIDNNLQVAGKLILASEHSGSTSIKTMQFYIEIESDLKRLKLLADRVDTRR